MRRKGRLCTSRAAACVAVCVGEFVARDYPHLCGRAAHRLHRRKMAVLLGQASWDGARASSQQTALKLMTAGVRTEEPLPSQPSKKSSETSATEGRTCLEVRRSATRTRERGGHRPHQNKTCGHFQRGASAGQRGAFGASRRATGGQAGRCGPNAPRTAARFGNSVEHGPLYGERQNNEGRFACWVKSRIEARSRPRSLIVKSNESRLIRTNTDISVLTAG